MKLTIYSDLTASLRISGAKPPFLPITSWRVQGPLYLYYTGFL